MVEHVSFLDVYQPDRNYGPHPESTVKGKEASFDSTRMDDQHIPELYGYRHHYGYSQ